MQAVAAAVWRSGCSWASEDCEVWLVKMESLLGRGMPNGEPALLKKRQQLRREQAEQLWRALRRQGWRPTEPVWGLLVSHKNERALNPSQRVLLSSSHFGF